MSQKKKKAWAENGLEDWGSYMAAKKGKLEEQFEDEAKKEFQDATSLFKGIAIFVNGYTNPCADELKRLMMAHGGIYHHYMRSRITTHIIASNLPYSKIIAYRKSQNPLPICKPEWITDSLKAQKILDWRLYVLYSNSTVTQPQLQFATTTSNSVVSEPTEKIHRTESDSLLQDTARDARITRNPVTNNENHVTTNDPKSNSNALCTKNSEFLSEFYNNSRLHHISTMGATFKDYVNELRAKNSGIFRGLERLKLSSKNETACRSSQPEQSDSDDDLFDSRPEEPKKSFDKTVVMHIDMDCFFVSVGLRNKPELRGLPIAVTHAKGNKRIPKTDDNSNNDGNDENEERGSMSEIASCSYEARKFGIKNGMFLGNALKLCPNLKTINYDFEGYKQVSYALYDTVASYTLDIEAVSCDEMYADVTSILTQSQLTPLEFASVVRNEIREKTGCPVSTGFGCNKLQARLATRKAKPDGQFYLKSDEVEDYVGSMVVRDLPGVGSSTMHLLHRMNVRTCSDLQKVDLVVLQKEFGKKTGEMLHNMCRGLDNSKMNFDHVRKSVSAEVNYGIRFECGNDAEIFLRKLSGEVADRLRKAGAKGRSVTLKLMIRAKDAPRETAKFMGHGVCDNFTKSKNFIGPVDDPVIIAKEVISLWNQMQQLPEDVRGIGIQISRLESVKSRSGIANMMNFVNKSKPNVPNDETNVPRGSNTETSRSSTHRESSNVEKNDKVPSKNFPINETKPRGLRAFLVAKSQNFAKYDVVTNSKSSIITETEEIDESVLAELPSDIRMEIMKFRDVSRTSVRDECRASTSSSSNNVENSRTIGPLRLTDEKTKFSSRNIDVTDGVGSINDIDQSVFNELPDDIKNEILGSKNVVTSIATDETNENSKFRQPNQENFFKHKKSMSGASVKTKMPAIEEINMAIRDECRASTSSSSNTVENSRTIGPLRLTDEKTKFSSRNIDITDGVGSINDIDQSVFNELPDDIKNEILGSKNVVTSIAIDETNENSKFRQPNQENFFKHKKSTSRVSVKTKMPAIEEIDMAVLVELPDDIRNEIMNEYRANKRNVEANNVVHDVDDVEKNLNRQKIVDSRGNVNSRVIEDANVSFSQVDPDFLAALSDDMKTDVRMYCLAKKNEKNLKITKFNDSNAISNVATKNRNTTKNYKKKIPTTKSKIGRIANGVKRNFDDRQCVKKIPETTRNMETMEFHGNKEMVGDDRRRSGRFLDSEFAVEREPGASLKQREEIISHHSSFTGNRAETDENREMLTNLVNYLFTLPVKQVKMQIQTWISNSNDVNEIDSLSLATFLSMLPKKKRLEDLHILLKTMHRCITRTGSCVWHEAYIRTVDNVQRYMQIEYNSNLMLPRIECERRECGN